MFRFVPLTPACCVAGYLSDAGWDYDCKCTYHQASAIHRFGHQLDFESCRGEPSVGPRIACTHVLDMSQEASNQNIVTFFGITVALVGWEWGWEWERGQGWGSGLEWRWGWNGNEVWAGVSMGLGPRPWDGNLG